MSYQNAGQFDRALKKAIKNTGGDLGNKYRQALRDRFLCRVFNDTETRFVLKGGSGLLARVPNSRATRDIDFATSFRESADSVVNALNHLVSVDMGDFLTFELSKREELLDDNGYSRLLKLCHTTRLRFEEKDPILIDLSLDCGLTLPPDTIVPANRLEIEGIETRDYLVYSLPDQLADKLCGIMETQPSGYQSSRMKDLVDVIIYTTNVTVNAKDLYCAVKSECARRSMNVPDKFAAPSNWSTRFSTFAIKHGIKEEFANFEQATKLACSFFDPVLLGSKNNNTRWNCEHLCWVDETF